MRRGRIRPESGRDSLQGKFETKQNEQKGAGRKNNFIGEKKKGEEDHNSKRFWDDSGWRGENLTEGKKL